MELAAELSWQYEMYYQLPTGLGIVPVQQSAKVRVVLGDNIFLAKFAGVRFVTS